MDTELNPNKLLHFALNDCRMAFIFGVLVLSGCQTASVDALNVGSPQALTLPTPVEPVQPATIENSAQTAYAPPPPPTPPSPPTTGAVNNGFYPTIGRQRSGAAAQLSTSDTDSIRDQLRQASAKSSQRATTKSAAEYQSDIAELRKKAASHGKKALDKIENVTE